MRYLKRFNESVENVKSILTDGFETLMYNTHLVKDQVNNNLEEFLEETDFSKLESKFGKITKFLGAGVFGAVFQLNSGKILKITFDFHEAPFLYEYCKLKRIPGLVKVDDVFKIKFGKTNAYVIIREPVLVITDHSKYEEGVKRAEVAMYKISPAWRGTHVGNFGMQDGEVVLYDGFCKKAPVNENKIPFLQL